MVPIYHVIRYPVVSCYPVVQQHYCTEQRRVLSSLATHRKIQRTDVARML